MILTKEQIKSLKNGTNIKVFLTGDEWGDDFGTVSNCIKVGNRIYETVHFYNIDEMDELGYEFVVALKKEEHSHGLYGVKKAIL